MLLYSCRLQSPDGRSNRPVHHRTTPWIGCVPKWLLAGVPNVIVTLEYLTLTPPSTHTVNGVGLPNGAGAPLPVVRGLHVHGGREFDGGCGARPLAATTCRAFPKDRP